MERINKSDIEKLVFTDTIPIPDSKRSDRILQLSIAPLFAEAIKRVHEERPISDMLDQGDEKITPHPNSCKSTIPVLHKKQSMILRLKGDSNSWIVCVREMKS